LPLRADETPHRPTFPFVINTTLTGLGCQVGMSRPDLIVAIVFAAVVSGSVTRASTLCPMFRDLFD
jgi:hypothetical protein